MNYKILQEKYKRCCQLVIDKQLYEAFIVLKELVMESKKGDLLVQWERDQETYQNILKYSFGEVEDPQKKPVYYHLLRSVLELADETREAIISAKQLSGYWHIKQNPENKLSVLPEEVKPFIDSLKWNPSSSKTNKSNDDKTELYLRERHKKIVHLFNILWLNDKYQE